MFGGTGALFSGLALAGVVYAILLQRQELSLQRHELELTRMELARAAKAQEEAADLLREQLQHAKRTSEATEERARAESTAQFGSPGAGFSGPNGREMRLTLHNHGLPLRELQASNYSPATNFRIQPAHYVPAEGEVSFLAEYPDKPSSVEFIVAYKDRYGNAREMRIDYDPAINRLRTWDIAQIEM